MKLIILLSIFMYALSMTSRYYMDCKDGADELIIITRYRCNQYNPDGGYCCYVTLEEDDDDFFYEIHDAYDNISKFNSTKLRKLYQDSFCLGVSQEGYDNIEQVVKELKNNYDVWDVKINCWQKYIEFNLLNILILLLIAIIFYAF